MSDNLLSLLDRPIAYHRCFVRIAGSVTGAVFLSQAVYWSRRTADADGWFFKTRDDWEEETGLSRREQETARKALRGAGVLEERLSGVPAKLHYRVDVEALSRQLAGTKPPIQLVRNRPTGRAETDQLYKETETTTETTPESLEAPVPATTQKTDPQKRGSRLPADWTLPYDWRTWAQVERPDVDAGKESEKFRDYWHAKAGKDAAKVDWSATWRNWIRNARAGKQGAVSGRAVI